MKTLFTPLLIGFVLFLAPEILYSQWQQIEIIGKPWVIGWALDASDSMSAVFSADAHLFLTNDQGTTWRDLIGGNKTYNNIPVYNVIDVSMTDSLHIWAAIDNSRIIATSNGGKIWTIQFNNKTLTGFLNYIKMFDENKGIAMGDCKTYGGINDVFFLNDSIGWITGSIINNSNGMSDYVFKTTDGGSTWISVSLPRRASTPGKMQFVDNNNGWIMCSIFQILNTTDGGRTWTEFDFEHSIGDFSFIDKNNGWAAGNSGIYRTNDGGLTWNNNSQIFNYYFSGINFINQNTGFVVGKNLTSNLQELLGTNDGGQTWSVIKTFSEKPFDSGYIVYRSLEFIDNKNGFMLFNENANHLGIVLKTTDGGLTWLETSLTQEKYLSAIRFQKNNSVNGDADFYGWIIADVGKMFFTSDLGNNWNEVSVPYNNSLSSLYFLNKDNGYIVGNNGMILKTNNGGTNWQMLNGEPTQPAVFLSTSDGGKNWNSENVSNLIGVFSGDVWRRVDFVDANNGFFYASGERIQKIYKTSNSGKDWQATNYAGGLQLLKFYNRNLGFAVNSNGNGNFIMDRTENGAESWQSFTLPSSGWANDLEFIPGDPSKIWFTNHNNLYYSADTGKTWQYITNSSKIRVIKFTDQNHGWLLGDNGALYKTSNNGGMVTTVDKEKSNQLSTSFELYQNYPNPFNPSTVISYKLPVAGMVTIKIYDLLGREIATLLNEYKQPGWYNYQLSTFNHQLTSGVYFYRLTTGKLSATKKFVLLK